MKNIADYFKQNYESAVKSGNPLEFLFEAENLLSELITYVSDIYGNEYKDLEKSKNMMLLAKELFPWEWKVYNNLCDFHYKNHQYEQAENYAKEAISKSNTTEPIVLYNLACIYYDVGKKLEAINLYKKVLDLSPNFHVARYNLACSLIHTRNFEEGWQLYEERFKAFDHINKIKNKYNYSYLTNINQIKSGSNLLLFNEQGIGDVIFCLRYIKILQDKNINIYYDLDEDNLSLIKSTKLKNLKPYTEGSKIDFFCSFMSLPYLCLKQLKYQNYNFIFKKWNKPTNKKPKIGIVFAGSPSHPMDYRRSMRLSQLSSILEMSDFEFHLLQKKDHLKRMWKHKNVDLLDYKFKGIDRSQELTSFNNTLSIMNELDMLISVDTSIVHLAGSIGMPCLLMLDKGHDFRWGIEEENMWYKSVKFVRQKDLLDWTHPVEECKKILHNIF